MKVSTRSIVLIFSCLFITSLHATAENTYQKAWDAFLRNERSEARLLFKQATEQDSKADAYLSLCLLDWSESRLEDAFINFKEYYKYATAPDAYLYGLYSMPFSFAVSDVLEKEKLDFLEEISQKPMHGTLKAMIYETLGKHYMGCNDFEKSEELFKQVGALRNWQILGTFNNISGSGFDKDWGAVLNSNSKHNFTNLAGATINWYSPGLNKADGWFDFIYYFVTNNVIAYAQSFVSSPEVREVYIRTGTSGSLKIWVNDALITSVKDERNCDMDIYISKAKLNKGTNRILVQLGQSEINALNFLMRITDEKGNPINDITASDKYAKYSKAEGTTSSPILLPFFAEEYLLTKIKEEPTNPLHQLVLAETYLRNDKADEGIMLLKELQQTTPASSYIHYRLSEAYLRARNQTFYTKEIENLKKDDANSFQALETLCNEAISSQKITEVKNISQKIKELYGESITTRQIDIWLANKEKKQEEYIALAKSNYEKYPYNYNYVNTLFYIEEHSLKNTKAATAIIEKYCANYFNTNAIETLSSRYIKDGDTEKGLQLLKERIERLPYAIGFIQSYANTLYKMQRYEEALEATDRLIKLNPALSNIYVLRADIYKAMKDNKKAIENYKKSIYYDPTSFESRTQLRQLEGKKEMGELFPRYNLDSLITASPSQADYPDDNSIILLYDTKLMFYPEGASEYHVDMAVKILNQTGIEIWKEYGIPYYSNQRLILDKAEIIKENGQKVKAETNGGHIVFTNLEAGNTLYLEYRIKDYASDIFSKHFYDQHIFQFAVPSLITSYSILAPKNKKFNYKIANGTIEPQLSSIEDMTLYRWILTNQPAMRMEPLMSAFVDVAPTLSFSSIPNWEFVGNWYKDLTNNKFKDDYLLKETFNEILKGKENAGQLEKARLFYEYILKNTTYSNVPFMQNNYIPQKASRTLSTRLGDCKDVSTLFVALCRMAGIEANLVLILTRDNGRNSLPLPSNRFNHCIAQLKVDGKTYYLELTDNKLPFGSAAPFDLQSPILVIPYANEAPSTELKLMDMAFRPENKIKRISQAFFSNNDIITETTNIRHGFSASGFRESYANLGSEDQLKQITQIISSDYTTPIKITDLKFDDLNSRADSMEYSYWIEAKNMVQEIAGMQIFRLKWSDNITSLEEFSLESRKYPFEFWIYMMDDLWEEYLTLTLPEGKTFMETPKEVHLECTNAEYKLSYEIPTQGTIKAYRMFKRKTDLVTPDEYETFIKFMQAVSENDNKQYGIR